MAAHRATNLITRPFGIPVHFQRSDPEGLLWKAYENDRVLLPADTDGTIEGQRLCRWWSSRHAFQSEDSYELHYQRTEPPPTPTGASPTSTSTATKATPSPSAPPTAMSDWSCTAKTTRSSPRRCWAAVRQALAERDVEDIRRIPHGMITTQADTINADLLAFLQS